jgi:hypothetical protein
MMRKRPPPQPNYTVIALDGLFTNKQKTPIDEMPPKWLTATHTHQPGCSFGPSKSHRINQHTKRLQNMRQIKRQSKNRFSWKKDRQNSSSPTIGSPHGSTYKKPSPTIHIPFNSKSPKICWFDQYGKVPEDEDSSLYHDQFHFHLRQLAKQERTDVLDRDKRSWLKATPYIDRSIQRGLSWSKSDFVADSVTTAKEQRMLYLNSRPVDSGHYDMASSLSKTHAYQPYHEKLQNACMRSKTKRMVYRDPLHSGLGPPQVAAGKPSMVIKRPKFQSISFLSSSRERPVHSGNHHVQSLGRGRYRGE